MITGVKNFIICEGKDRKKETQGRQHAKYQSSQVLLFCLNRSVFVANLTDGGAFGIIF